MSTEGILGENSCLSLKWIRISLIVDSRHAELVRLSGFQPSDVVGRRLSLAVDFANTHPLASGSVHFLNFVFFDGQSTVVIWFGPAQFASFLMHIRHLQRSFG